MTITDAQGIRTDWGPGSGLGHTSSVRMVNVPTEEDIQDVRVAICPAADCATPIPLGRIACPRHARSQWGQRGRRW